MFDLPGITETQHVILVQGTPESSDKDDGPAWWQVDSQHYNSLQAKLPPHVQLASHGRVFRWSGDNNEGARRLAAAKLLEFLKPLESAGTSYHLVGHSHGGAVIWSALRLAAAQRERLAHLRSWSTVGTPFLHYHPRSPWSVANVLQVFFASLLLYPAVKVLCFLARLPFDLAVGNLTNGVVIRSDDKVAAVTAILRAPILKGLELLGVPLTEVPAGIRVGSYDPTAGEAPAKFLFGSSEGWLILTAIVLSAYITLLLASFCVGPVMQVVRNAWEKKLERRVFKTYGNKWLGIWTRDDEAINGLRKTLKWSVSLIDKMSLPERSFPADWVTWPVRPLYWLVAPVFNRTIHPRLDATLRGLVAKTAQGNNRPARDVVAVSPHPVLRAPGNSAPPLPDWLSDKIRQGAERHSSELGSKIRGLLGEPSLAGLDSYVHVLSGQEFVHTAYFDHPEVLELLALNISRQQGNHRLRRAASRSDLSAWYEEFKSSLTLDASRETVAVPCEQPSDTQLRRKAA